MNSRCSDRASGKAASPIIRLGQRLTTEISTVFCPERSLSVTSSRKGSFQNNPHLPLH